MKDYVEHYRQHFNETNIHFPCGVRGCICRFRTFNAFKSHVYRHHQTSGAEKPKSSHVHLTIKCTFCVQVLPDIKDMLGHLKEHIAQGVEITCPFQGCNSSFKVKSSFTSLSRVHKGVDSRVITPELLISSQETKILSPRASIASKLSKTHRLKVMTNLCLLAMMKTYNQTQLTYSSKIWHYFI